MQNLTGEVWNRQVENRGWESHSECKTISASELIGYFYVAASVYFAIPGDLNTLTGGYGYDRRLISGLLECDIAVTVIPLSRTFPVLDAAAAADADSRFSALPDDAIVLVDGLAYGVLEVVAQRHGKRLKLIALCHHPLALENGLSQLQATALHRSEKKALNHATAIVVTSADTAKILINNFAIPKEKITVAMPGTDRQSYAACKNSPPILLTVATLTRRKAHDVLIDALSQISHLPWSARFVGGADFDPDWAVFLRRKVQALDLEQRITFVGSVTDPAPEYAQATLFVLPSLFEGYGMVFAEALSFGLPIVAARAGAVPALVPPEVGILVPPNDINSLAQAMATLLSNPDQLQTLRNGAQFAAKTLPTWEDTATIVADLLRKIRPTKHY